MDLSAVDWGSFPDYLAVFGIVGGLLVGIRTWAADRRQQREDALRREAARLTGAAMVVAYLIPPARTERLQRALLCRVESLARIPILDVELVIDYVGPSPEVPPELRRLRFGQTVVVDKSEQFSVAAEKWPESDYSGDHFQWELQFTDVQGQRWSRKRTGMPTRLT